MKRSTQAKNIAFVGTPRQFFELVVDDTTRKVLLEHESRVNCQKRVSNFGLAVSYGIDVNQTLEGARYWDLYKLEKAPEELLYIPTK